MIAAIHCEYCSQLFISCFVFISYAFDIEVFESILSVVAFIENIVCLIVCKDTKIPRTNNLYVYFYKKCSLLLSVFERN